MTLNEFLKKYTRCPFCWSYAIQGNLCYGCKWRYGHGQYAKDTDFDLFDPNEVWKEMMEREVHFGRKGRQRNDQCRCDPGNDG